MKVVIFGATGMVGQGALRACLDDSRVERVVAVGRSPVQPPEGLAPGKLESLIHKDFLDFSSVERQLSGYDACFWCLGVSSVGMSEADYSRVTYEYTMAAARVLAKASPGMTFVFVSGSGADSTEKGSTMWARVKGRAENALFATPRLKVYVFRPGYIQAGRGIVSRTALYRALYVVVGPLFPLIKLVFGDHVTTTENVGRAMLNLALDGGPCEMPPILANRDINRAAGG